MKLASSIIVLTLGFVQAYIFLSELRKKNHVKPTLSTWIIFLMGTILSMTTYLLSKKQDFASGVMIIMDVFFVAIFVIAIYAWGDRSMRFHSFEKWYLAGCAAVVGYGLITGDAFGSNLYSQGVIATGYLPTYQKLIRTKMNTESYRIWGVGLLIGFVGLVPGLLGHDTLAIVYACRQITLILITMVLMYVYDVRRRTAT